MTKKSERKRDRHTTPTPARPGTAADTCPCGSGANFAECCGRFIDAAERPRTAEELMRSRYTAYTRGDLGYLSVTWHPRTRPTQIGPDPAVRWIGLEVIAAEAGGAADDAGVVEFIARYKVGGRAQRLHERSRFERHQGAWLYVEGDLSPGD
jgi:SEC-C motif domain protein